MDIAEQLLNDGVIEAEDYKSIKTHEVSKLFSVHWELRTILYLGILLLTTGLGILIYLNIDTIGHQAVLAIIAVLCGGCFYYVFKNKQPYRNDAVKHPSPFFDYIALLACLLLGIFIGYIQFQYTLFGHRYGLATQIPSAVFLYCAYIFDHKGLLSLAIVGIAGTIGLSIAPMQLVNGYDLSATHIVFTALLFGAALIVWSTVSGAKNIKTHFSFTYHNFGINILFASCLTLLFNQPMKALSFLLLLGLCVYFVRYAITQQSFWFLLLAVVYTYIGLTYSIFSLLLNDAGEAIIIASMLYLMASCIGVILFFINYKKILGLKK
jgi:hypothetical protein